MKKLKEFFYHLLIPNEKNNYQGKVLHHDFLTIYLLFALIITFFFKKFDTNILGFATDISIEKLYQLTNKERIKNNLPTLNYNEKLAHAAYLKAKDMFANNYWSHYAPDGKKPWDFILEAGYDYEYAGENLAKNFLFSQGVISAWMNSPSHKENILKKDYTDVGFAVVNGVLNGEETTLVVQMFGKPINQSTSTTFSFPIKNTSAKNIENINTKKFNVLAKTNKEKKSPLKNYFYNINILFFGFLLLALLLDFYYINKLKIIRFSSKNFSHLIFIIFIIIGLLIITKGAII